MRLLLTTDAVGGVWDHTMTLARGLAAGGHEVTLAVIGRPQPDRLEALPAGLPWASRDLPLEWMEGGPACAAEAGAWIDLLARRSGAELVHLNQLCYAPYVSCPTVVAVHGDALSWFAEVRGTTPPEARWSVYRDAVRRGLAAACALVAPSAYQARLTRAHYGHPVDHVIWNGVEPSAEAHAQAEGETEGAEPAAGAPLLAAVGRAWDEAKGLDVLEDALERCASPWRCVLAGDAAGPEGQRFQPRSIEALGRLSPRAVRELLRRAQVFASPALYEPFGLAVVEAAQAGCALVLSDIGSFREIWDGHACFFPPGDAAALAEALDRLAAEPALRRAMGRRAAARALGVLGPERMTQAYLALYRSLLEPSARVPAAASLAAGA